MSLNDIDIADPDLYLSGPPHARFATLRREAPVYWHRERGGRGFWAVTRHAEVARISRDPATFSSSEGVLFEDFPPGDIRRSTNMMIIWTISPCPRCTTIMMTTTTCTTIYTTTIMTSTITMARTAKCMLRIAGFPPGTRPWGLPVFSRGRRSEWSGSGRGRGAARHWTPPPGGLGTGDVVPDPGAPGRGLGAGKY